MTHQNDQLNDLLKQFEENNNIEETLNKFTELGEQAQKDAGESLEALKRPVKEMMENKDNHLPTQLHQLKEIVTELEPTQLQQGQMKKFFNKLLKRNPVEQYARKYKTIEAQVENIVEGLLKGRDKLQEDSIMLDQLKEVARSRMNTLEEQINVGKQLNTMLENELLKEENDDRKLQIQKGQQKVISRIKNMSQAVVVLQQSIASVDIIKENNEKLEEAIFNAITMTKNIITVTASIQLALGNQQRVINAVKHVNETTESMLLSNAKLLKENTEQTLKTLEEPAIAFDSFKKAYEDVATAIALTEQSNERIIESGKKFIVELDELSAQMKRKLLP